MKMLKKYWWVLVIIAAIVALAGPVLAQQKGLTLGVSNPVSFSNTELDATAYMELKAPVAEIQGVNFDLILNPAIQFDSDGYRNAPVVAGGALHLGDFPVELVATKAFSINKDRDIKSDDEFIVALELNVPIPDFIPVLGK